ncbi:hypothetical protein H2O64_12915 [Kordia sp. YSTF-M3]|uniref:Uncharacterized protein n=1 Tax=Kordia aestuariivivens TaxID=2759037 RepID=A0ABR7QB44_9FLAO|nr:hypothetical protein [Kordia aestuariivivens]MBC8755571.1 hypothetical protein [Kordia aestuariivivens]
MKNKKSISLNLRKARIANLSMLKAGAPPVTQKDCESTPKDCPTTITPRTDSLDNSSG